MSINIQLVPVDLIDPHPHNPRRDLGDLTELADSIRAQGIRQNLLLVSHEVIDGALREDRYVAVIGHRRLAAAKLAGLTEVPAAIDPGLTAAAQVELMLLENIQRNDLSPVEEADGYQQLLDLGVKVREIAKTTGRAEKTITARLRLAKLPDTARAKIHTSQATLEDAAKLDALAGHAKLLKKAADALGTPNFRWVIEDCRSEVRRETAKKEIRAELKKLAISHHTADSYAYIDYRPVATLTRLADLAKAVKAGIPAGAVWINNYSGIAIIRPTTDDERNVVTSSETEREKARAHDDAIAEEGHQAARLRGEFITTLFGRRRLAAKEHLAIVATCVPWLLADHGNPKWDLDRWLGAEGFQSEEQTHALMASSYPDVDPACWLLLALHMRARSGYGWASAAVHPQTVALYGLLEQLGYPVSDVERARVFPEPDADDEAAAS